MCDDVSRRSNNVIGRTAAADALRGEEERQGLRESGAKRESLMAFGGYPSLEGKKKALKVYTTTKYSSRIVILVCVTNGLYTLSV